MLRRGSIAVLLVGLLACAASRDEDDGAGAPLAEGASGEAACVAVTEGASVPIAIAAAGGEHALTFEAASDSATSWGERENEAVILEVVRARAGESTFVSHVVLHQGADGFTYGLHAGALAAGDALSVRVSPLSARKAAKGARLCNAKLAPVSSFGPLGEGIANAPVFHWPVQKRFDDLPLLVGWSKARRSYQAVYSNENGGTVEHCGGGAKGIQGEIARWGRSFDIEGMYGYGGESPTWGRCTGSRSFTPGAPGAPRMEGAHPHLYYGDGHNRLYESRAGYGRDCGSRKAEKSDGDLDGWNENNPGNEPEKDDGRVLTLRLVPVELDVLEFPRWNGRREGVVDTHAPWVYRIASLEIEREGRIDGRRALPMDRYLYVDVHAADVGGRGDRECAPLGASGGFVLRAHTKDAKVHDGPQMTAAYFGGDEAIKRLAVPLARAYAPGDFTGVTFDAYDDDGIYFLALRDAFVVRPEGQNGASIHPVSRGIRAADVYVDDDRSGCASGVNADGPAVGFPYPCVGGQHFIGF